MEVLCASPWIPVEWIAAHGISTLGVWSAVGEPAGAVPEGACAFAQAMAGMARAPSTRAIILSTACDQMRRSADACAARSEAWIFLLNLPATWQSPAPRRLYHAELERLGKFLVSLGGHAPTAAELLEVIERFEQRRDCLRKFCQYSSARKSAEALARFFRDGSTPADAPAGMTTVRGVPVAIAGGPLLPSQWALFDTIERAGGCVVLNAAEPGERCLLPPLPPRANDEPPLTWLANYYFDNMIDVFSRPNSRLYSWLAARLSDKKARGIVLWAQVGCDLWRAEAASLREAFGLPVLTVDSQGFQAGGARAANRLGAFIESLQ